VRDHGNADSAVRERWLAGPHDLHDSGFRLRGRGGRFRIDVAVCHRRASCAALFVEQIHDAPIGEALDGEIRSSSQSGLAFE